MSYNSVILSGVVGNVEVSVTKNNTQFLKVVIGTSMKDKDGAYKTTWQRVRFYGERAERYAFLKKKDRVCVFGFLVRYKVGEGDKAFYDTHTVGMNAFLNVDDSMLREQIDGIINNINDIVVREVDVPDDIANDDIPF